MSDEVIGLGETRVPRFPEHEPNEHLPDVSVPRRRQRAGATERAQTWSSSQTPEGRDESGMAPAVPLVLIPFGDAQKEVAQSTKATVIYLKGSKDPSTVMRQHELFRLQSNEHGAVYNAAIGITIVVDTLMTHSW